MRNQAFNKKRGNLISVSGALVLIPNVPVGADYVVMLVLTDNVEVSPKFENVVTAIAELHRGVCTTHAPHVYKSIMSSDPP